ncbi:SagB/ThcOx family dehydrogenase [Mitsuaria sp. WAJ17]|uniref:SagB/ThcOx family dehydrogenase n=1 Tax=Mitsuaria sp. WAJ17 TaxID=2761452 RepID=UPI00160106CD|nr:SagB/ThcOx family dehydrogenase [Mitsuaria sp. WAJ17]MBB2487484.1 SagB/ThcOx family dehydrogenase [Mitsuaria sp. WAJ17]
MNTFTKLVLGAMGRLRPEPALGASVRRIVLPAPRHEGGMGLLEALELRGSSREFSRTPLTMQMLSDLLWAADGVNRQGSGRTAPSALGAQELQVYVTLPQGAYRYLAHDHALELTSASDVRRITGYQDFVEEAPLDLVYVADHSRMALVPVTQRESFAHVAAGAVAQNVYLFCAAQGLSTVLRAWIDREAIAQALGLPMSHSVLLSQTVGHPKT